MSDSDDSFWTSLLYMPIVLFMIFGGIKACDDLRCTPERKGRLHTGYRGGLVEVCDGENWVPAKGEVGK
jgi:hypothetical protein